MRAEHSQLDAVNVRERFHFGAMVMGAPEPLGPTFDASIGSHGPSPNCTKLLVIPLKTSVSFEVNTQASRCPRHCVAMAMMRIGAGASFPLTIGRPAPEFICIFCLSSSYNIGVGIRLIPGLETRLNAMEPRASFSFF